MGEPLTGHTGEVTGVAFNEDGSTVASAGRDGTIRSWAVASGRPLGGPLTAHTGQVTGVAFSPKGSLLASASQDGTVRLWDFDSATLVAQACSIAHRNLSRAEWNEFLGPDVPYVATCASSQLARLAVSALD